eukprot:m.11030 g.11030  ORF g.11030 m.11030 type:complete len:153 (-) comp3913_c0_seq1:143-601(-)
MTPSDSKPLSRRAKCQLYYAGICALVFILAVPCFLTVVHNWVAGTGCLVTTVYTFLVFVERFHQVREEPLLSTTYPVFGQVFAVVGMLAGAALLVFCAIYASHHHESLDPTSHWLGVVWGFLLLKWAATLLLLVRSLRSDRGSYQPLSTTLQ